MLDVVLKKRNLGHNLCGVALNKSSIGFIMGPGSTDQSASAGELTTTNAFLQNCVNQAKYCFDEGTKLDHG